ncbi:MAG: hypothetical protein WBA74_17930 [Cyclobacteriaceae bacterium]
MVTPAIEKALSNSDPVMQEILETIDLPHHQSSGDVFYDLITCVLDQQIHYRSKGVYMKKFVELTHGLLPNPKIIRTIIAEDFAEKKIAGNKYESLQHLASYWTENRLDMIDWTGLPEDEVREKLSPIKGVGPWTINMIMLYTLQHPDIFDPNDYQLKKVMKSSYGLDDKNLTKEMSNLAENWRPYRSYATRFLLEWGKKQQDF